MSKEIKKEETAVEAQEETQIEVVELEAAEETKKDEAKLVKKEELAGIAYIFGSGNNTIVHITDMAGNTIARISGGMVTKQSRLKANPTTAMFVAKRAAERAKDVGINTLYIRMRGQTGAPTIGPGAHAAMKTLGKEGFKVAGIIDVTRIPRGGPKKKGGKRGRRV